MFDKPKRPWDKERFEKENKLINDYGVRRKKEIWRAESILRNYRNIAKEIFATKDKDKEAILLKKLNDLGLITKESNIDDVLALTVENVFDRRLQTVVFKKGLANTQKQARQYIVHGHIAIDGKRVTWPNMIVRSGEEHSIKFYDNSKVKKSKLQTLEAKKPPQEVKAEEPKKEEKPKEVPKVEQPKVEKGE